MDIDEVIPQPPHSGHATEHLAMTLDLEQRQPLPGTTESNQSGLLGRLRRWTAPANSTDSGDDVDELELRYRHWSCCS
jgi:hypothetical protein